MRLFVLSVSEENYLRCRGQGIWIDISVVRFLPLSFYAKKKVAERKARIRGIAPRYAALLFGAVSPLYIPLMTAQPIATWQAISRNARQVLCLAFLIWRMHVCCLSFLRKAISQPQFFTHAKRVPIPVCCFR